MTVGVWVVARTPLSATYPCACWLGRECRIQCSCRGRTDVDKMPAHCCSRRFRKETNRG